MILFSVDDDDDDPTNKPHLKSNQFKMYDVCLFVNCVQAETDDNNNDIIL